MIPRSAMIRTHLARGAVRAGFLLRGRPKKVFEVSPAGAGFPYWGRSKKLNLHVPAKVPWGNCRLHACPSPARMYLAHPSQRADLGITSCRPLKRLLACLLTRTLLNKSDLCKQQHPASVDLTTQARGLTPVVASGVLR